MTATATGAGIVGAGLAIGQQEDPALALMPVLDVERFKARYNTMVQLVKDVMKEDRDFGTIPGTEKKSRRKPGEPEEPSSKNHTLYKAGAEKLCTLFGLVAEFVDERSIEDFDKGLFYYVYRCVLKRNGRTVAEAIGSCNSLEKKYRRGARVCPECGVASIKRSRFPARNAAPGTQPGWYCDGRSGGCGLSFEPGDERVLGESATANPAEAADLVNTLQKMAQKRAFVGATLIATNASEFFAQEADLPGSDGDAFPDDAMDRQRPSSMRGRRPVGNRPVGEQFAEDQPDLLNNSTFLSEWVGALVGRNVGWTDGLAEKTLAVMLKRHNTTLENVNWAGRSELIAKARNGRYDSYLATEATSTPPAPAATQQPIQDTEEAERVLREKAAHVRSAREQEEGETDPTADPMVAKRPVSLPDPCPEHWIADYMISLAPPDVSANDIKQFMRIGLPKPWDKLSRSFQEDLFAKVGSGAVWERFRNPTKAS